MGQQEQEETLTEWSDMQRHCSRTTWRWLLAISPSFRGQDLRDGLLLEKIEPLEVRKRSTSLPKLHSP